MTGGDPRQCMRCDAPAPDKRWLCESCSADELWERENPDDDDYEQEPYDNCHLMPDGQCLLAGTEECDWECGRLR